jgi:hypothetical protein
MALFPMICVLRGFPPAAYPNVRLNENHCAAFLIKKLLIYEFETCYDQFSDDR